MQVMRMTARAPFDAVSGAALLVYTRVVHVAATAATCPAGCSSRS